MSNTQEAYIQTLRQIKDAEDDARKEVEARKREVEEESIKKEEQKILAG